ncbi:MAG TPA: hypothetical protein VMZ71_01455, partial [Gemmataceae bacterium]|nr:hypothetical protein [Gemmataceae bacterium]
GRISGTVTNTIQQLPPKPADGPDVRTMLTDLVTALNEALASAQLSEQAAVDAAKKVNEVAEAAKLPKQPGSLDKAKDGLTMLGYIVVGATAVADKVTALKNAIAGWFA